LTEQLLVDALLRLLSGAAPQLLPTHDFAHDKRLRRRVGVPHLLLELHVGNLPQLILDLD
jgi:hypothetical protein